MQQARVNAAMRCCTSSPRSTRLTPPGGRAKRIMGVKNRIVAKHAKQVEAALQSNLDRMDEPFGGPVLAPQCGAKLPDEPAMLANNGQPARSPPSHGLASSNRADRQN